MDDTRWDELDHLGQKVALLNRLLDRAADYGDHAQTQRLETEIAKARDLRHDILMSIAEASIASASR